MQNAGTRRAAKCPSIKIFERFAPERDFGDGIGADPMEMMINETGCLVTVTVIIMCQHVQQNFNGQNHSGQFLGEVHASR